jgi:hypothetical protein
MRVCSRKREDPMTRKRHRESRDLQSREGVNQPPTRCAANSPARVCVPACVATCSSGTEVAHFRPELAHIVFQCRDARFQITATHDRVAA